VFVITRVRSGRCGAVSIDLDELITEHYGITRAEVAPELESLPSIRPQAAAPSSTPSPRTLQRFSRDAPQTRLVGAGCGRSHPPEPLRIYGTSCALRGDPCRTHQTSGPPNVLASAASRTGLPRCTSANS
jgi:hypothetical protein